MKAKLTKRKKIRRIKPEGEAKPEQFPFWTFGNAGKGRPPKELCFTDKLRDQLTKQKKFRRPDGSLLTASELDLIVMKVIQELRTMSPINVSLLNIILNRIEGKPPETVNVDQTLEVSRGLDAKELLLQRLSGYVAAREVEEGDSESK